MLGVFPIAEGISKAESLGVDLIEVSPNVVPPVCRLTRLSKYIYLSEKKKASKVGSKRVKEVKIGVSVSKRDLDLKIKKCLEFLTEGHSLKISVRMKGRELAYKEIGNKLMTSIVDSLSELSRVSDKIQYSGSAVSAFLIPIVKKNVPDKSVNKDSSNKNTSDK